MTNKQDQEASNGAKPDGAEPEDAAPQTAPDSYGKELAGLDYEAARDELVRVMRALEAGGLSLEDSLALWERGELLARVCEHHLAGARERVESALARAESVETTETAEPHDD